jgi:hypothetical protein
MPNTTTVTFTIGDKVAMRDDTQWTGVVIAHAYSGDVIVQWEHQLDAPTVENVFSVHMVSGSKLSVALDAHQRACMRGNDSAVSNTARMLTDAVWEHLNNNR